MELVKERNIVDSSLPVGLAIKKWIDIHGRRDPRPYLDCNWHSVKLRLRFGSKMEDIINWCKDSMPNDHFSMFDKIWFTSKDHKTLFVMTWIDN